MVIVPSAEIRLEEQMIVVETPRLILRQLTLDDLDELAKLYADPVVRKFYHPSILTREEVKPKLERMISCYEQRGFGLWATTYKADNKFVGQCGLIAQIIDGQPEVEIGYMLAKEYWGQGLATEAAIAIRNYGFEQVGCDRLISLIDPGNIASQKVAAKVGLSYEKDSVMWGKTVRVYALHKNQMP